MPRRPSLELEPEIVLAQRIKEERVRRGWTYDGLAARMLTRAGYKIAPSGIHKVEAGDRRVTVNELQAYCLAFDVPAPHLLQPVSPEAVRDERLLRYQTGIRAILGLIGEADLPSVEGDTLFDDLRALGDAAGGRFDKDAEILKHAVGLLELLWQSADRHIAEVSPRLAEALTRSDRVRDAEAAMQLHAYFKDRIDATKEAIGRAASPDEKAQQEALRAYWEAEADRLAERTAAKVRDEAAGPEV